MACLKDQPDRLLKVLARLTERLALGFGAGHKPTLLGNRKVLVVGGAEALAAAELFQ
jgi:hypothetical protein